MIIEAHILCYNEAKMVRHTLRHYSAFCGNITVYDNQSTDNTLGVIKKHFPQVKIEDYYSANEINDKVYQEIKNTCWKGSNADYVIVCDMDEFLYAPNIVEKLKELHRLKVGLPKVEGYNMYSEKFPVNYEKPLTRQVHEGVRNDRFDKQIIFSPQMVREINYLPGCHRCIPQKSVTLIKEPEYEPLKLLHMKYLGPAYVKERYNLYSTRLSEFNRKNGFGAEYPKGDKFVDELFSMLVKHKKKVT